METVPETCSLSVPATDRAFLYGDGLFETLLVVNGRALWLDLHLDRLLTGAQRLYMRVESSEVSEAIDSGIAQFHSQSGILRVTVSRGSGPRGYAPDPQAQARVTRTCYALERDPFEALPPAVLASSSIVLGEQPLLAGLKHCNRLEQVMAAAEARDLGVDDVALRNGQGTYQCSSNANLFVLHGDLLITPPCDGSGVLGTRRRFLIETLASKLGLSAQEKPLETQDLRQADGVFLSNSIMGVRSVSQWDGHRFGASKRLSELQNAYFAEARRCCAT